MILIKKKIQADSGIVQGFNEHSILPITFFVIGILGEGEYILLEYFDGYDWQVANMFGNEGKILDVNNAVKSIYASLSTFSKSSDYYKSNLRVTKSVTSTPVGVGVSFKGA
jgi:hypothetical protein